MLLRRLSVFAGGWTLEAAEEVCAEEGADTYTVLDLLTELVDRSLVEADDVVGEVRRYRMLETIREYSWERLRESNEEEGMRRRHLTYFLALAEEAEPHLWRETQLRWLQQLEDERANMRAALQFSGIDAVDHAAGWRLAGALAHFWVLHCHYTEGRQWVEPILEQGDSVPIPLRAKACHHASAYAYVRRDFDRGVAWVEEACALYQQLGDTWHAALALCLLGIHIAARDRHKGLTVLAEAVRLARTLDDPWLLGFLLWHLAVYQTDLRQGGPLYEEALPLVRQAGERWNLAGALLFFGRYLTAQGNYVRAEQMLQEANQLARETGNRRWDSRTLKVLGFVYLKQGDHERSLGFLKKSLQMAREIDEQETIRLSMIGLIRIIARQSDEKQAARLLGAADTVIESLGPAWECASLIPEYDCVAAGAREALGEEAFTAAWAEGRSMTQDQAIELALTVNNAGYPLAVYGEGVAPSVYGSLGSQEG